MGKWKMALVVVMKTLGYDHKKNRFAVGLLGLSHKERRKTVAAGGVYLLLIYEK